MLDRLSQREKWMVAATAAVALAVVLWLGVFEPYRDSVEQADARVASRLRQLGEVRKLQEEYRLLQGQLAEAERRLVSRGAAFSLFSFIEEVTQRSGVRENLISMRPQSPQTQGEFREESVEIRMERMNLEQLVRLLYSLEQADTVLSIKTLRARPRFDNRALLDITLLISSFQKAP